MAVKSGLLLVERILDRVLRLFLVDLASGRRCGVVGCWSKCMSALRRAETLRGDFGFRKQLLVDFNIQSHDRVAPWICFLRSLEQLKVDRPFHDVTGGSIFFESEDHFAQAVWRVQLKVDFELDNG